MVEKSQSMPLKKDSGLVLSQSSYLTPLSKQREDDDIKESNVDSALDIMMHDVLLYASKHRNSRDFKKKLNNWHFTYDAEAAITFGNFFSAEKKHLIVKRLLWESVVAVDVFLYQKGKFKLVCGEQFDPNTYVDDTIKDINGDHLKDFLVHWYPSSGCCRRDIYYTFLYQTDGSFTHRYNFINPTFSPSEKIIRGLGYGHPGDVELYKYKWNGLRVDTIEMIFPDTLRKRYHIFKRWKDVDNYTAGKFIKHIPKEYQNIESYDWFEGVY
jgi:hypothetical protein